MSAEKDVAPEVPEDAKDVAPEVPEDAKARFRAALDRKQQAAHRSEEARRTPGGVQGSEVTGNRRTFRRKTG